MTQPSMTGFLDCHLKPYKARWRVQVWHSGHWRTYPMEVEAFTDTDAARSVRRAWGNYKLCRVKCAEFNDTWRRIRFEFKEKNNATPRVKRRVLP